GAGQFLRLPPGPQRRRRHELTTPRQDAQGPAAAEQRLQRNRGRSVVRVEMAPCAVAAIREPEGTAGLARTRSNVALASLLILGAFPRDPQPGRPVVAGRGETAAVGTEGDGTNGVGVPLQDGELLAGGGVPQPRRPVVAGRGDAAAVGAEGHRVYETI